VALLLIAAPASAQHSALADSIHWLQGPATSRLGSEAELRVPENCSFTGEDDAEKFMRLTGNPPDGLEKGILLCQASDSSDDIWFVVFSYDDIGYVRDDEGSSLDSNAILSSIRKGTESSNKERRKRGWQVLTIDGWVNAPHYDSSTHNLTWAMLAHDEEQNRVVNHSVRLLGRSGVLHADLVLGPQQLTTELPAFNSVIGTTHFLPGNTYAEWRDGDKVAAYGLTALVAGGAGAAAVKLGLFGKLWKLIVAMFAALWKVLIAALVGIGAWLKNLFKRSSSSEPARVPDPPPPDAT
jgi:uncharacterized membrane-anchored protein